MKIICSKLKLEMLVQISIQFSICNNTRRCKDEKTFYRRLDF